MFLYKCNKAREIERKKCHALMIHMCTLVALGKDESETVLRSQMDANISCKMNFCAEFAAMCGDGWGGEVVV